MRSKRLAAMLLGLVSLPAVAGLVEGEISGLQPGTTPVLYSIAGNGTVKVGEIPVTQPGYYSISLEPGQYSVQYSCPDQQHPGQSLTRTILIRALDSPVVHNIAC